MKEKEKRRVAAEKKEKRKKMIEEYRGKIKDTKPTSGSHRVLVRYPSGIRVILCFSPSESLKNLFDSIISNPACPNYFKLRSVHPNAEIHCFPEWYQNLCHEENSEDVTSSESKESVNSTHTAIGFQPLGRMDRFRTARFFLSLIFWNFRFLFFFFGIKNPKHQSILKIPKILEFENFLVFRMFGIEILMDHFLPVQLKFSLENMIH
ncbi:Protein CBR-UBXN-5 [Caenorhabditis briggsae]|uniref:Protein CBR-UBXN-5 n=1 Tax=Caenorhabditis briggsae TaxID=6238 RepID=A8XTZ0_CAEBR|nr:Protein CBR-UBXN-5 [Caenorhabditis briggsae]CAP36116.1 Protein CBR-UBXN-5 [Caenorhabditis briggsae]